MDRIYTNVKFLLNSRLLDGKDYSMIQVNRNRIDFNVPVVVTEFNPLRIYLSRFGLPHTALDSLRMLVLITHNVVEQILDRGKNPLTHQRTILREVWKLCEQTYADNPTQGAKLTENVVRNHVTCYLADYKLKSAIQVVVTDFTELELFFINPNGHPTEKYCSITLDGQLSRLRRVRYLYDKPVYNVKDVSKAEAIQLINSVAAVFPKVNDYTLELRFHEFANRLFKQHGRIGFVAEHDKLETA